jgi:hypothetical protein
VGRQQILDPIILAPRSEALVGRAVGLKRVPPGGDDQAAVRDGNGNKESIVIGFVKQQDVGLSLRR